MWTHKDCTVLNSPKGQCFSYFLNNTVTNLMFLEQFKMSRMSSSNIMKNNQISRNEINNWER